MMTDKLALFLTALFFIFQAFSGLKAEEVTRRGLVTIDGNEYYLETYADLRDNAKAHCNLMEKNLIIFDSVSKWHSITHWLNDHDYLFDWFWTGAMRDVNTTNWYWEPTGAEITDFFWANNQPSMNDTLNVRSCISFSLNFGGYDDDNCEAPFLGYICE